MACEKGYVNIVDNLLREFPNFDINRSSSFGAPIFHAIRANQEQIVLFLLENNVDLVVKEHKFLTNPIGYSLYLKNTSIYQMLIEYLLKLENRQKIHEVLNNKDKDGSTLLHYASLYKFSMILKNLLSQKEDIRIDPETKNESGHDYKEVLKIKEEELLQEKEKERKKRDELRELKVQEAKQRRTEEENNKNEKEAELLREQKLKEFQDNLTKNRCKITAVVFALLFLALGLYLHMKIEQRKERVI